MRKALIVGINDYPSAPLRGAIYDASSVATVLERHGDESGTINFDVHLHTDVPTRGDLRELIQDLFSSRDEIDLFYFSGHGYVDRTGAYLVTPDARRYDAGISADEILSLANESASDNRIIILDCCHSGAFGTPKIMGDRAAYICEGVTIMTASRKDESAIEMNGHGVFSNLFVDALMGGAADVNGNITPGSIYAYIDQSLGSWEQRPVFKTNISQFASLRKVVPKVSLNILREIVTYFPVPQEDLPLDPSYEDTNYEDSPQRHYPPYALSAHVYIFKHLQKFQSAGLVEPVDTPFMYFAAMDSKACRLTALGHHYWRLVKEKRL